MLIIEFTGRKVDGGILQRGSLAGGIFSAWLVAANSRSGAQGAAITGVHYRACMPFSTP